MAMSVDVLGAWKDYDDVGLGKGVCSWRIKGVLGVLSHNVNHVLALQHHAG